jgi:vacuolar protein sorting-associated protein 33A
LPLLLSLAAPSMGVLLSNPLPPSTPASVAASKYPFTSLRKSLRLLIDDTPEAIDEVENDISFVYSGYAPISIRLVQCVAQKGGVISNPAEREKNTDGSKGGKGKAATMSTGKVQAHPIVGWKGFEDVLSAMPGQTFDIIPKGVAQDAVTHSVAVMRKSLSPHLSNAFIHSLSNSLVRPPDQSTTTVVFFLGGCTYTELAALRWVARQNRGEFVETMCFIYLHSYAADVGRKFLIATTGMVSGASIMESIAGLGTYNDSKREADI